MSVPTTSTPCPRCDRSYALPDPTRVYACVCGGFLAASESIARLSAAAAEDGRTCSAYGAWAPPGSWFCGACGADVHAGTRPLEPDGIGHARIARARSRVQTACDVGRALYAMAALGALLFVVILAAAGGEGSVFVIPLFAFAVLNALAAWKLKSHPVGWALTMAGLKTLDAAVVCHLAARGAPAAILGLALLVPWAAVLWYVALTFLHAREDLGRDSRTWFVLPRTGATPADAAAEAARTYEEQRIF